MRHYLILKNLNHLSIGSMHDCIFSILHLCYCSRLNQYFHCSNWSSCITWEIIHEINVSLFTFILSFLNDPLYILIYESIIPNILIQYFKLGRNLSLIMQLKIWKKENNCYFVICVKHTVLNHPNIALNVIDVFSTLIITVNG